MGPYTLLLGRKVPFRYVIIAIIWALTYVSANSDELMGDEVQDDNRTCILDDCKRMARIIRRQMGNETPCKDFSTYVCGNWRGHEELKPTRLKWKAVTALVGLLKNDSESSESSSARNKLIRAFESCTTMGKDNETLIISIRQVIAGYNVTKKPWPIVDDIDLQPARTESDAYVDVLKKTGPRPVFSYYIYKENGRPVIAMTKPSEFYVFGVEESGSRTQSDEQITSDSTTPDYKLYDDMLANDEKAYEKFLRQTITLLNDLYSQDEIETAVKDIVRMEKGFSNFASSAIEEKAQRMNLSYLGHLLGNESLMVDIMQKDFQDLNINITGGTPVLVKYIEYFEKAVKFMKCNTKESLYNYVMWGKIRKMAEAEGTWLHKLFLRFKRNSTSYNFPYVEDGYERDNADRTKKLHLKCILQLLESNVMYTAGANYYIKAKFNETSKEQVLKMLYFINSSFIQFVENNTWMTNHTKQGVITRLQATDPVIGYPGWMLNDTIINKLYKFVPLIGARMSFVQHFHHLLENDFKQELLMLDPSAYTDKTNEDVALRSHAYIDERTYTLAYPAASLVTHYREPPIPRAINFGTIGTVLAQLLTLILDRYHYGFDGLKKYTMDTWDAQTTKYFCNRSSCLNNTEECNGTIAPSRNKLEKLFDYLGIRLSYQAMLTSKMNYTPPYLLPDKNGTFSSEEKIFLMAFGSLYCPYSVNEKRANAPEESIADDKKVFNESLNEVVYTYRVFNATFNCSVVQGADSCILMPEDEPTPEPAC